MTLSKMDPFADCGGQLIRRNSDCCVKICWIRAKDRAVDLYPDMFHVSCFMQIFPASNFFSSGVGWWETQ